MMKQFCVFVAEEDDRFPTAIEWFHTKKLREPKIGAIKIIQ